ncbi:MULTISPECIES: alpha-ketoacid dehydrogenase subunit beta [unclassified Auritidibacter]|uniref:alpha-ketoacid dehydrogenase subunit beta n=1 Tax=unclassified Auritidibacter TaxID=2634694 RepID=UPI000D73ADF2|nr:MULTISPECIES: transketolase C-terminal domain-containing protein [unclassified Auritidibacter]PXA78406.1 alpha-ketoacid dehydrogenase subunit beta [Auritidibacter sp. NML100628]PXA79417.1 alpha-ketoacid dehydrogenase subunit beta [Auritidibacter sp. NML120636]
MSTTAETATKKLTIGQAINQALAEELASDDKVLLQGEDIGSLGGVYRVTEGLKAEFGGDRVVDSPLTESGIIGTSIGLALAGYRPVAEIQFDGFVYPGFDQITSQLAKLHARMDGAQQVPVTIRLPYGGGIGSVEHHGESPEALFTHTAGLRILTYSTAHDAYWLTRAGIRSHDPVMLFEPKRRYFARSIVDFSDPGHAADPWKAVVAKEGTDLTLVVWGAMTAVGLAAAEAAEAEGISIEVVDLRSLSPIDFDTLEASLKRTTRMVVAHEASVFGGLGGEIAARLTQRCFYYLQAPIARVGGWHIPYPPSQIEHDHIPDLDRILDAVDTTLAF